MIQPQPFYLYDSLSADKQLFQPINTGRIGIYICGITVYDYCHIGHARTMINFDVIVRYLRHRGWRVHYVRNITDIDDKILNRAQQLNISYQQLTEKFITAMNEDFAQLQIISADEEPHATQHIDAIIDMISILIAKKYAYTATNGDVYYRVSAFADYGKLSAKNIEELLAGARVAVNQTKQDHCDFALWKAVDDGEVGWASPWGRGRPGWHIECSVMAKNCLGKHFDIHGGGPDLCFPHHENEIAQSEAANDCTFANYWLHTGALRVDGEKMSKSLNNFFTIRDVLQYYHPEVIRYLMINGHYRTAMNYSETNLREAKAGLDRFYRCLSHYPQVSPANLNDLTTSAYYQAFTTAMDNDFNSREALAVMYQMVKEINQHSDSIAGRQTAEDIVAQLKSMGDILGIFQTTTTSYLQAHSHLNNEAIDTDIIDHLIDQRQQARQEGNYEVADEIRNTLLKKGIYIEDSHDGTRWHKK